MRWCFDGWPGRLSHATNRNVKRGQWYRLAPLDLRVTIAMKRREGRMRWCVSIGAILVAAAIADASPAFGRPRLRGLF